MAYLKNTSAPPDSSIKQMSGRREAGLRRAAICLRGHSGIVSRVSLCYIRWNVEFAWRQADAVRATHDGQTF
jgi:hypothetical protein